jgi:hypothetical protein
MVVVLADKCCQMQANVQLPFACSYLVTPYFASMMQGLLKTLVYSFLVSAVCSVSLPSLLGELRPPACLKS